MVPKTQTALQKMAEEAMACFEQKTRPGSEKRFWTVKDGSPTWVTDMVREAHEGGHILPDDYRYAFVVEALDVIKEADDPEEAADELEADFYTSDLLAWMLSRISRTGYVDEAVSEFGWPARGLDQALMMGQAAEKREVFATVLEFLRKRIGEEE